MTVDEGALNYVRSLPVMRMTCQEFRDLHEYSCTVPTGTTPGKKWKRHEGAYDQGFIEAGGKPRWVICQYDPNCSADAKAIRILYFRPVVSIQAEVRS